MKLQELLVSRGIALSRTKLLRHNITNKVVGINYARGYLDLYQSIQSPDCFKNCDTIITFLGTEGTNGVFKGCYKVGGYSAFEYENLPDDFAWEYHPEANNVVHELTKLEIFSDLEDRLVIDWGKGTLSWRQNATNDKEILEIRPAVSEIAFAGYDKVLLSYETLRKIVYNKATFKEWEDKLSAVAGVYLITDTKTGRHYVGSASGEEGGIWGRWSEYAHTKHGGNKRLVELIKEDPDYCYNFQYSILEVFPIKRDKHEVLKCEALYKKKLCSIQFGLNDN